VPKSSSSTVIKLLIFNAKRAKIAHIQESGMTTETETKFEPQCKDVAAVYENIARVLRMCESASVETGNAWKHSNQFVADDEGSYPVVYAAKTYYAASRLEFAVGVVDGVPVFRGDTVYYVYRGLRGGSEEHLNGKKCTITGCGADGKTIFAESDGGTFSVDGCGFSLTPPKPKTKTIIIKDAPIPYAAIVALSDNSGTAGVYLLFASHQDAQKFVDLVHKGAA
jgi:hypothetical protein